MTAFLAGAGTVLLIEVALIVALLILLRDAVRKALGG